MRARHLEATEFNGASECSSTPIKRLCMRHLPISSALAMSRTATQRITAYKANVVHSLALNQLQVLKPGLVGVDAHGRIAYVLDLQKHSLEDATYDELVDLGDRLLIPGFVDGHAHAPQHSFVGVGMHLPLLDWLQTYTFPYEARFENVKYARSVYSKAVRRHLFNGTTTCSYFATIHLESCKALADIIQEVGQRGYVGKVNMDRNATAELTEKTETSIAHTREFVDYVLKKDSSLITPVLTPRFVPSTTSTLMNALADISREHSPPLPVQSHLSENPAEVAWVKSMHPDCDSYTDVYDRHGLLHDRSYMAHCIWCSKSERDILRNRKTGIIHCPNSNFSLSSGVLNVRRMLQEGIKVGLGTDVSGGYSPSMLDAIRQAVIASKLVSIGNSSAQEEGETTPDALTYAEAFHMATVGGAEALGLSDTIGNFVVGKEFDALVIDPFGENSPIDCFDEETDAQDVLQTFQKFLFLGDDRNIEAVFVQGKAVKPSAFVKSA